MLTPEEEIELLELENEQIRLRSRGSTPAPEELSGIDTARGAIQSGLKGVTAGFGDEIVGAGRAALSYPIEAVAEMVEGGDLPDRSFGERYEQYRDDERGVTEQFAEENPASALALELTGGLVSPLNKVVPNVGSTGTALNRFTQSMGRGATEGALYGLGEGEGDLESQVDSMKRGAAFGGGTSGVLTGAGGALGRTLSKRNVKQNLLNKKTGEFTPTHLADKEGTLGELYRNTIGRAWGGKRALARQEKPFLEAAESQVDDITAKLDLEDEVIADTFAKAKATQEEIAEGLTARTVTKLDDEAANAVNIADDDIAKYADNFRKKAARESLPEHARKVLDDVDTDNPQATAQALNSWWNTKAFGEVKDKAFLWDNGLKNKIRTLVNDDPVLLNEVGDALERIGGIERLFGGPMKIPGKAAAKKAAGKELRVYGTGLDKTRKAAGKEVAELDDEAQVMIDGAALMEIRNFFARGANKSTALSRGAQRKIANKFDDMIRKQLDDVDVAKFDDQIDRYTTKLSFIDATGTNRAREAGGRFTPKDWIGASGKYGGKAKSFGKAPLETTAVSLLNKSVAAKARGAAAKQLSKAEVKASAGSIRRQKKKELARLKRENLVAKRAQKAKRKTGVLKTAKDELRDIKKAAIPEGASGLSSMLTTSTLGAPFGLAAGLIGAVPAALVAGTGIARGLSTQGAQRTLAGQTGMQKALAEALRKGDTALATRILSRTTAGQMAGEQ